LSSDIVLKPINDALKDFSLMHVLELDILAECIDVLLERWLKNR
jgi:hypothetical protein